ncbi:tyrosine-type recombinase/integrase [Nocardia sp. NPDC127579]|uniref:tyrosine-type recombinase/integrase n=1 Tax=Nocardia sp. NPDC127579 TaxID=3345402 RepID=UPI00363D77FD
MDEFAVALRAAGIARTSVELHTYHMRRVARSIGVTDPREVTSQQLVSWCGRQSWEAETRRSYYQSFRKFWDWAAQADFACENAATELPSVKPSPPNPRPTPYGVYKEALATAQPRERIMLRLSAEAGMRRGEVAQAHSRDLIEDDDGWWLRVHGKGGKERMVPIRDEFAAELRKLRKGYFFPGRYGIGHLSAAYVGKRVRKHLDDENTMHKLRHMFGTRTYRVNKDVFVVQELLGHASAETTRRYVKTRHSDLRSTVEAAAYS